MARINIGKRSLVGSIERYAKRFDLLEVRVDPATKMRPPTLRKWRKAVPASFVFSVVLPSIVTELRPSKEADEALAQALETARILESPVIVIPTPMSVTPTVTNKKRLEALVAKLPSDVVRLVWEPSGLWEVEDAQELASSLGLTLVRDPSNESVPAGPIVYARLRGLGETRRLSANRIERIVKIMRSRREAYVVIETDLAQRVAKTLRESLLKDSTPKARVARVRPMVQPLRADDEEQ